MGDTYRPRRPTRGHPPPLSDRITFSGGSDSYRPREQHRQRNGSRGADHSEFTFSTGYQAPQFPPTGPANAEHSARPRRGRDARGSRHGGDSHAGPRSNANAFRRRGFQKEAPHQRALLQTRDDGTEHVLGVSTGSNKFRNVEDISDDEEAAMDLGSDQSDGEVPSAASQNGKHKVSRLSSSTRADGNSVPKWSNPDPYTVLPPPEETTNKRFDVVKFIRKAKNMNAEKADVNNAVAANDDFISFGDDDTPFLGSLNDLAASGTLPTAEQPVKEPVENVDLTIRRQHPGRAQKRKRVGGTIDIVEEWLPTESSHPTPWATDRRNSHLSNDPTRWLHNEIIDFTEYVTPSDLEWSIRQNLIDRVERAIGPYQFPQCSGRIQCFGSFPAGLYLPTADMDLVYTSEEHLRGGSPAFTVSKNQLWKVARKLESKQIATKVTVIPSAKVPIIKFIDRHTEIPVDVSFENLGGVYAQDYFSRWKRDYPDMVDMVALIKQFLVMRGINEVNTGGLGGFSIICLVVSYIQLHPKPKDLGHLLLGFLDYYGNVFDLRNERIIMDPPAVVSKGDVGIDGRPEKPFSLSIQDPNRSNNNISGGSYRVKEIFQAFSKAHEDLSERIEAMSHGTITSNSILETIIAGNYNSYDQHRKRMRTLK